MAQKNMSQQIEEFNSGLYNEGIHKCMVEAGWWDWFCSTKALANKTKKLYKQIIRIVEANKLSNNANFDPEKVYIRLKNCCPVDGKLYDTICIFAIDHQDSNIKKYVITPKSGHTSDNGKANLYIIGEDSIDFNDFKGIVEWFKK